MFTGLDSFRTRNALERRQHGNLNVDVGFVRRHGRETGVLAGGRQRQLRHGFPERPVAADTADAAAQLALPVKAHEDAARAIERRRFFRRRRQAPLADPLKMAQCSPRAFKQQLLVPV